MGEFSEAIKLTHRYNELEAFLRMLRIDLEHRYPPKIVADLVAIRNFAGREQLVVKARMAIGEIDSQLRAIRESGAPVPEELSSRKANLEQQVRDWDSYEHPEWCEALVEIWERSDIQKKLAHSELEHQTRQFVSALPTNGHKRTQRHLSRDQRIWEIIQTGAKGPQYAKLMEDRGIKGGSSWEKFPGYAKAYKASAEWREKINKEKTRITLRMKGRSPEVSQVSTETKSSA